MRKDKQYATNFWCQFVDGKSNLFYNNFYLPGTNYFLLVSVLQCAIMHFANPQSSLQIITLAFIMVAAYASQRWPKLQGPTSTMLNCLSVLGCISTPTLDDPASILFRVAAALTFVTFRNTLLFSTWLMHCRENVVHLLIMAVYLGVYSQKRFIVPAVVCGLLVSVLIYVSLSYSEAKMKRLWGKYEYLRKSYQIYVDMIFDLPVPIFIVNAQGDIIMQNYLSYRILPKDIDIVKHKYSGKPTTIDQLVVSQDDLIKFKDTIEKCFSTNEMCQLECSLLEHPYPMLYYFKKVNWKRQPGVQVTCVELSEFQSYLFHNINQFSMQVINSAQNISAKQVSRIENELLERMERQERQPSLIIVPKHPKSQTSHKQRTIEEAGQGSEDDCSILSKKVLSIVHNVVNVGVEASPKKIAPRQNQLSEEEKFIKGEVALSPIPNLFERRTKSEIKQSSAPRENSERYDVEEKINKYMHHIEKGVSRTLENILAEIMSHKGKKVNIHFKRRNKFKNYETSPESSETMTPHNKRVVTDNQKRPSLFKPIIEHAVEFPSAQEPVAEPPTPPTKKVARNKFSGFLSQMREDDMPPQTQQVVFEQPEPVVASPLHHGDSPAFRRPEEHKVSLVLDAPPQKSNWSDNYSFQAIQSPGNQGAKVAIQPILEEHESKNCSVELLRSEKGSIEGSDNVIAVPKFTYCDIVTYMVVDDFVFVLNSAGGMKLAYERQIVSDSKGSSAFEKFKNHLAGGKLFHFLLIDFEMPKEWSGYQLVENIRAHEKEVGAPPSFIIGLDNDLTPKKLEAAISKGYNDAIEKPLNPKLLNSMIASSLERING